MSLLRVPLPCTAFSRPTKTSLNTLEPDREEEGWGYTEAPRGALGHWIHIKDKKTFNYQAVVPSTWNASPRDTHDKMGPYEASLIDTPIADPEKPLEILRTIHSFDPCMACGVHILDAEGQEVTRIQVV